MQLNLIAGDYGDFGVAWSPNGPPMRVLGRERECVLLDALISSVRRGESRSLVLRGEAGIGKTALLDYLVESASDLMVARATGIEFEMEPAFASLHQLCAPCSSGSSSSPLHNATQSVPSSA